VKPLDIRPEQPSDHAAIRAVTKAAFAPMSYSSQTEAEIIEALRAAGTLTVSLVAIEDGELVGHVAFSPVTIEGESGWFGLGPVAVKPGLQRGGIGSALIRSGLDRLRALNAKGCVLVGDSGYYGRFGFKPDPRLVYEGLPAEYFLVLPFTEAVLTGVVKFHPGFEAT
jgi:putative acetyltransferase